MSRSIHFTLAAPLVIPLRADRLAAAAHFLSDVPVPNSLTADQHRQAAMAALDMTEDQLDNDLHFFDGDGFDVQWSELRDARLRVAPSEGTWGEMNPRDLKTLVTFIERFATGLVFPVLLHSIRIDSSTYDNQGEELTSEFVELSPTGCKIYKQSSPTNNQFWGNDVEDRIGKGFMSTQLTDGNMAGLTPTSEKKFV